MRNPAETKQRILEHSGILFNTQGYKATSISQITDATGLTKGAIYRHFESKEQLENETLKHLATKMFVKLKSDIKQQKDAPAKLRAILLFFKSYAYKTPLEGGCPLLNAAVEADDNHPSLKVGALDMLRLLESSIITILENGIKYNQLKAEINTKEFAILIIAGLEGAIMISQLRKDGEAIHVILNHLKKEIEKIEK